MILVMFQSLRGVFCVFFLWGLVLLLGFPAQDILEPPEGWKVLLVPQAHPTVSFASLGPRGLSGPSAIGKTHLFFGQKISSAHEVLQLFLLAMSML